jgi:uncharacterized protein
MIVGQKMSQRILAIDVVRGVALFGVLVVNVITEFRVSLFQQFLSGDEGAVERIVDFALESKAIVLFSLLFGVGLAIQHERLRATGRATYFLVRRLIALLAFGLLHLLFIWNGDILTEYAFAGFVVLPFLRLPAEGLGKAALFFVLLFFLAFVWQPVALPDAATLSRHIANATDVYAHGSYAEIWRFSLEELRLMLPLHVNVFPRTVALMLLGAAIWKSGVLLNRSTTLFAVLATLAGLGLTAMDRPLIVSATMAPIVLALGYGALVYAIASWGSAAFVLTPLAALGRMAFTNYVLQSVVFSFVFFGYGAGQFGKMGAGQALVLGVAVYVAQVILSTIWLRHFRHGPLEWLWRFLMYGSRRLVPDAKRAPVPAIHEDG